MRSPRADFVYLPIRTRAALGPRSTGTKTGPHGACLTAAAFLGEAGKTPVSKRRGKPGSGAEPSGGTGGECRKRERRKVGAQLKLRARRAYRGHWLDNAPFGAPLSLFRGA
jgi:hypothetical protein